MTGFISKKAHEIARYLEKKGEKLSRLKWEEAEFVPSIPWKPADGRTIIYGETHILLAPNGCWFAWRQGRGYVLVPRRPAFKWNIQRIKIRPDETFFIRDEDLLQEMHDMIDFLISIGKSHEIISRGMGMSRWFILKFRRGDHIGVKLSTYLALKAVYERNAIRGVTLDADAH